MDIKFTKYQGTGNDFVILDNREGKYNNLDVKALCDRRFGIGADGLMLLENAAEYDFKMVYYNSDGAVSTMCGNGGRCLIHFAHSLNIFEKECNFIAIDGPHTGRIEEDKVFLKMNDVNEVELHNNAFVLNTGSPHYVQFVPSLPEEDFVQQARAIRMSPPFLKEGINVNFIEVNGFEIKIRTFERGVEDETLSCGTGVTAAAIAALKMQIISTKQKMPEYNSLSGTCQYSIITKGGNLLVSFDFDEFNEGIYSNIWLIGPAKKVFTGEIKG